MRTKEEILMNILKQNYTERIFKFQKLVNHDLTLKAMQEYAEEYHKSELLKLNKSDVISLLRQLLIAFIIEIILIVILVTNI